VRRTFLLLVVIAATSATASAQPDPRTTIYKGPVRVAFTCGDQDLTVRHVTNDAAMGGQRTIEYAFKNKSSSPCTLNGFPRFELLNKSGTVRPGGRAINSVHLAGDETNQQPQPVIIEPGKQAGFRVYYNSGGAGYVGKPCPFSRRVRITAPGTTRHFVLRERITSCREVQVSAVRRELAQ
jgi:hypothetical protein